MFHIFSRNVPPRSWSVSFSHLHFCGMCTGSTFEHHHGNLFLSASLHLFTLCWWKWFHRCSPSSSCASLRSCATVHAFGYVWWTYGRRNLMFFSPLKDGTVPQFMPLEQPGISNWEPTVLPFKSLYGEGRFSAKQILWRHEIPWSFFPVCQENTQTALSLEWSVEKTRCQSMLDSLVKISCLIGETYNG